VNGFLDIAAAARFLSVSVRTVRRNLDKIPHHRAPFGLRFTLQDLAEYMAAFRREPTAPARVDLDRILGTRRAAG